MFGLLGLNSWKGQNKGFYRGLLKGSLMGIRGVQAIPQISLAELTQEILQLQTGILAMLVF